jgi:hypothetical protein
LKCFILLGIAGIPGPQEHKFEGTYGIERDASSGLPPGEFSSSKTMGWFLPERLQTRQNCRCMRRQGPGGPTQPAGLGSMSTQRRAHRTSRATSSRAELRFHGNAEHTRRAETREPRSARDARFDVLLRDVVPPQRHNSVAGDPGVTAPLMSVLCLTWAWLISSDEASQGITSRVATKSLLSDHRSETFAGLGSRRSSSPCGVRGPSESVPRAIPRSSPLHIPHLPARTRLHTTLPHAPVGKLRRAERHDGKRDLYFQHAA